MTSPEIEVRDRLAEALYMRAGGDSWDTLPVALRRWWQNDAAVFMASTLPSVDLTIARRVG